jgi:hypothetical protein
MGNLCGKESKPKNPADLAIFQGGIETTPVSTENKKQQHGTSVREPAGVNTWNFAIESVPYNDPQAKTVPYDQLEYAGATINAYIDAEKLTDVRSSIYWDTVVYPDENHRNPIKIQNGIRVISWIIQAPLLALGANTEVGFMGYSNPAMNSYSSEEVAAAEFLNKLWTHKNAREILNEFTDQQNVPKLLKEKLISDVKGQDKGTLEEELKKVMTETDDVQQRMPAMLALIRHERARYFELWNCLEEEWSLERFLALFVEARNDNEKQKRVSSNFGFALATNIRKQVERYNARKGKVNQTVNKRRLVFVVGGNSLDRSEYDVIKNILKNEVKGGGDEFSVVVIEVIDGDKSESTNRQQELDDANEGLADMYEYLPVNINKLFKKAPGGLLVAKIHGSHHKNLDKKTGKKDAFYGNNDVFGFENQGTLFLPTIAYVRDKWGTETKGGVFDQVRTVTSESATNAPVTVPALDLISLGNRKAVV